MSLRLVAFVYFKNVRMKNMRVEFRGLAVGCLLGLSAFSTFPGCSNSEPPEAPLEVTSGEVKDLRAKLPSSDEIEQAAGEAADAVADGVSAAWEQASSAMKNFEGGQEMLGNMKQVYASTKSSLSDVTSKESAEKAKAELNQLSEKLDEWKPKLSEMSEDTKVGVKRFFEHVAEQLAKMGDQLNDNRWVDEILKPKLRELIEQLKSLG